ncbi:hypothetical protein F2Q70_00032275 [Brassica cretica]|uniref:Uncharacterized protein n=1 Tax=Brassica cretica TaxID=69181 RepID=A0A8S9FFA9_BRACR|nr:hypothetical protein F2Q70_00032275 [Brassica cretica]
MWAQSGEVLCDTIDAEIRKWWKLKQQPETSALSGVGIVICQNCHRGDETIQGNPSNRSGDESQKSRLAVARRGEMNFVFSLQPY